MPVWSEPILWVISCPLPVGAKDLKDWGVLRKGRVRRRPSLFYYGAIAEAWGPTFSSHCSFA